MKKIARITTLTLLLLTALLWGASSYFLNFALQPVNEGKDLAGSWDYMLQKYPYLEEWRDSLIQASAPKIPLSMPPMG